VEDEHEKAPVLGCAACVVSFLMALGVLWLLYQLIFNQPS
jgi:hypothetical protein